MLQSISSNGNSRRLTEAVTSPGEREPNSRERDFDFVCRSRSGRRGGRGHTSWGAPAAADQLQPVPALPSVRNLLECDIPDPARRDVGQRQAAAEQHGREHCELDRSVMPVDIACGGGDATPRAVEG